MAEVKFVNIAKYKGVRYPAHTPFAVEDKDVEALVQKGAIVTVPPAEEDDTTPPAGEAEGSEKSIDEMKVDELKAYAAEHEIDISAAERKADILAVIKAAEGSEE